MLKCCKARFDVIVARPCEWIVSFDLDECSELRGIICELAWFDTANVNELPFNDKRDVGIAGDGIVSKPKLLSTDVDSSVVGDAAWLRRRWTINKSVYLRVLLLLFKIKCRKMRALADNDQHINQQIYRRLIQCSLAQQRISILIMKEFHQFNVLLSLRSLISVIVIFELQFTFWKGGNLNALKLPILMIVEEKIMHQMKKKHFIPTTFFSAHPHYIEIEEVTAQW